MNERVGGSPQVPVMCLWRAMRCMQHRPVGTHFWFNGARAHTRTHTHTHPQVEEYKWASRGINTHTTVQISLAGMYGTGKGRSRGRKEKGKKKGQKDGCRQQSITRNEDTEHWVVSQKSNMASFFYFTHLDLNPLCITLRSYLTNTTNIIFRRVSKTPIAKSGKILNRRIGVELERGFVENKYPRNVFLKLLTKP